MGFTLLTGGMGGGSGNIPIISTYSGFLDKLNNGNLIPGAWYQIEYRNYWRLNYNGLVEAANKIERLLVLATGVDTYSQIAKSLDNPGDLVRWDALTSYTIDNTYGVEYDFIDGSLSPIVSDHGYAIEFINDNTIYFSGNLNITGGNSSGFGILLSDTLNFSASGEGESWSFTGTLSDLIADGFVDFVDNMDGTFNLSILSMGDNFGTPFIPTGGAYNILLQFTPVPKDTYGLIIRRENETGIIADFDYRTVYQRLYHANITDNGTLAFSYYLSLTQTAGGFTTGNALGRTIAITPDGASDYIDMTLIKGGSNIKHITGGDPFDAPGSHCFQLDSSSDSEIGYGCSNIIVVGDMTESELYGCSNMIFGGLLANSYISNGNNVIAKTDIKGLIKNGISLTTTGLEDTIFLNTVESAIFNRSVVSNYFKNPIKGFVVEGALLRAQWNSLTNANILVSIADKTVGTLSSVSLTTRDGTTYGYISSSSGILSYVTVIS